MPADGGSTCHQCPHVTHMLLTALPLQLHQRVHTNSGGGGGGGGLRTAVEWEQAYLDCIEEGVLVLQEGACVFWQGVQVAAVLSVLLQAQQSRGVARLIEAVVQVTHLHNTSHLTGAMTGTSKSRTCTTCQRHDRASPTLAGTTAPIWVKTSAMDVIIIKPASTMKFV